MGHAYKGESRVMGETSEVLRLKSTSSPTYVYGSMTLTTTSV